MPMKTLLTFVLALYTVSFSGSAFASNSVRFYTVRTNDMQSEYQLAKECSDDTDQAAKKLAEISTRLTGNPNALTVSGIYGWDPNNGPIFPLPSASTEFYCILKFTSSDPSVQFDALSTASFTHLSRSTWDTACSPAYDAASANVNSPVTIYWTGWTLIQGRMCEVTTVTATKSTSN